MMRTAAIVNPRAASGAAARQWPEFVDALGLPEARFTERVGHAREIARELIEAGYDRILAVGGDGTISETVNGYLRGGAATRPEVELGFFPMGTGGDFRRSLGLRDAAHAIEVIRAGHARTIDAGHIEFITHEGRPGERHFINLTSFGMGGEVASRAKNFLSPASGKAAFLWATVEVFFRYRAKTVELSIDGGDWRSHKILNIAAGNGRYHGGGMHVCPKAMLDDGAIDVTVIDDLRMFTLAKDLRVLYSENLYVHPKTHWARGRQIEARSAERVSIEVDGEPLGILPVKIRVIPGAIRILAPQ
jgi:YegS/Rv2252/BmrU family lipid kinase